MTEKSKLIRKEVRSPCVSEDESPLILGAGGWNIFHHFGVVDSINRNNIGYDTVLGISAGSIAAVLLTNGYTADEMVAIFLRIAEERKELSTFMEAFSIADPLSLAVGGMLSLKPMYRRLVEEYDLKPNDKLKILACDLFTQSPYIFEGTDYDLVDALAASGAVPGVFQPVWHMANGRPQLLVDGAIYHYSPVEFTQGPAIVSKFRPASELPQEWNSPLDLYFHYRELIFPLAGNNRYVDEEKHLVIETGLPHVAALNNGLSDETMLRMVDNGRETADKVIAAARRDGRFCSK